MQNIPGWIEAGVAVVGSLGVLFFLLKGANNRGTIADLRSDNKDLRDGRADDRLRIADLETKVESMTEQLARLTEANRVLAQTITAADKIAALADQVKQAHDESMSVITDIRADLSAIKEGR